MSNGYYVDIDEEHCAFMVASKEQFDRDGYVESTHLSNELEDLDLLPENCEELAEATFISGFENPAELREALLALGYEEKSLM